MSIRFGRILIQQSRRTVVGSSPLTTSVVGRHVPIMSSSWTVPSPSSCAAVLARQDLASTRRWFSDSKTPEEPKADAAEEPKAPEQETEAPVEEPAEAGEAPPAEEQTEAKADNSKEKELEAQVKDLKDRLMRSLAEQDNTRRIAQRDVDAASQFAIKSFAKGLLDVSDNLTRALEAVPEDMRKDHDGNAVLASLYEGIELTDRGLVKVFESNGLVKYGQPGDLFDPNKHEALYEYVDPEQKVGTVGQVMKPGYMLRDRVLRPAEVGVVKNA